MATHTPDALRRRLRLGWLLLSPLVVALLAALLLQALRDATVFYYTPSEVAAGKAPRQQAFRVGGLVRDLRRQGLDWHFVLDDGQTRLAVAYRGLAPDLFAANRGAGPAGTGPPAGQRTAGQAR